MGIATHDLCHLLAATAMLLIAAHGGGVLAARLNQPRVIGELLGGLLLGPTGLGLVWPQAMDFLFHRSGPAQAGLATLYHFGLLLHMFCTGMELRAVSDRSQQRVALWLALVGSAAPLAAAIVLAPWFDWRRFIGPANDDVAFVMVLAIAVAVTSIPVIARIFYDLKILGTDFARMMLSAAVLEDVLLYVALAVALGRVGAAGGGEQGPAAWLGLAPASAAALAVHVLLCLAALATVMSPLPVRVATWLRPLTAHRGRRTMLAGRLVLFMVVTAATAAAGLAPMLGALLAGLLVAAGQAHDPQARTDRSMQRFSFAFFVPLYFAIVGMRLDLAGRFDWTFFLAFALVACAIKTVSVYVAARLARQRAWAAWNMAVTLNARGGPGIVLASLALDAGIVNPDFYAILVLLAVVTSMAAGSWLHHVVKRGLPLT